MPQLFRMPNVNELFVISIINSMLNVISFYQLFSSTYLSDYKYAAHQNGHIFLPTFFSIQIDVYCMFYIKKKSNFRRIQKKTQTCIGNQVGVIAMNSTVFMYYDTQSNHSLRLHVTQTVYSNVPASQQNYPNDQTIHTTISCVVPCVSIVLL